MLESFQTGWIRFVGDNITVDINCDKNIIITKLQHPKKKYPTKLARYFKNDFLYWLKKILTNPRVHTGVGKYLSWAPGEKKLF